MADPDWQKLAAAVRKRRLELGLTATSAATGAGINRVTWAALETGKSHLSERLWAPVERTLGWAPGSIDQVLDGGEPTLGTRQAAVHGGDEAVEIVRRDPRLTPEMKARIIGLIFEKRARQREVEIVETQRLVEVMREQAS